MSDGTASAAAWEEAIRRVVRPLPGGTPYENRRPIRVPGRFDGYSVAEFLKAHCPGPGDAYWKLCLENHQVLRRDVPVHADTRVSGGDALVHILPDTVEPDVASDVRVVYEDEDLLAIDKPAPLPVHPSGRYNKNTLISFLRSARPEVSLHPIHRLDAATSGLILIGKSAASCTGVRRQFVGRTVSKLYLAKVRGAHEPSSWRSNSPIRPQPGTAGCRDTAAEGRDAASRFRCVGHDEAGNTFVVAAPRTGRTHQLRIHLREIGCPVLGDEDYGNGSRSRREGFTTGAICLHAFRLRFAHPRSGERLRLSVPPPPWWTPR